MHVLYLAIPSPWCARAFIDKTATKYVIVFETQHMCVGWLRVYECARAFRHCVRVEPILQKRTCPPSKHAILAIAMAIALLNSINMTIALHFLFLPQLSFWRRGRPWRWVTFCTPGAALPSTKAMAALHRTTMSDPASISCIIARAFGQHHARPVVVQVCQIEHHMIVLFVCLVSVYVCLFRPSILHVRSYCMFVRLISSHCVWAVQSSAHQADK